MTFTGYYESLIWPRMAGGLLIDYASRGKGAQKRVGEILSAKGDINDQRNPSRKELKGKVAFNHLSFSYTDGKGEALKDISFPSTPAAKRRAEGLCRLRNTMCAQNLNSQPSLYFAPAAASSLSVNLRSGIKYIV